MELFVNIYLYEFTLYACVFVVSVSYGIEVNLAPI